MRKSAPALLLLLAAGPAYGGSDGQSYDQIARGRSLAMLGDCAACHTMPGGPPYAGGRPLETPFGTLLAPNLTPDRETGIGAWSNEEFVAAVREGQGRHGHLYPAMPYPYYTKMSRDDVLAIRDYLATLDPVRNKVISNQLPFPFSMRFTLAMWNGINFTSGRFQPVPGKSQEWNRGAYLVEGPAHCGACHTSKNILGGDRTDSALQGGVLQEWYAPNITGNSHVGLGRWSTDDIVDYLMTGRNRISAATGPMAEVIADQTSQMSRHDLQAIAVYLKDTGEGGETAPQPIAASDLTMQNGQAVYVDQCGACHGLAGEGIPGLIPSLKGNPSVQSTDPTTLRRIVIEGARSIATDSAPTGAAMPAFGWKLTGDQIAAVLTYIRNSWGNAASRVVSSSSP
jgi:mono/diheme cytochrome c family protein